MRFLAPQAADELAFNYRVFRRHLSFIAREDGVSVSARSMGVVNVQLIMEKMGGGGHLTMAGAQLPGVSTQKAQTMLKEALDQYFTKMQNVPIG